MQDEGLFIGLDTVMMTICTGLQTFVHPGIFFPAMSDGRAGRGDDEKPPEYKTSDSSLEASPERPAAVQGVGYAA